MTNATILIIGATGIVGKELLRALNDLKRTDFTVRILVRDEKKARKMFKHLKNIQIEYFEANLLKFDTLPQGLFENIERLFLFCPALPMQPQIEAHLVQCAFEKGNLKQVIKTSILGADINRGLTDVVRWNAESERCVQNVIYKHSKNEQEPAVSLVILRPNYFLQNLINLDEYSIKQYGELVRPKADVVPYKISFVDARDVGDFGAKIMMCNVEDHKWCTFDITGPEDLTFKDLAQPFYEIIERRLTVKLVPENEFYNYLMHKTMDSTCAMSIVKLFQMYKSNNASSIVTGDFKLITDQSPRTVKDFLQHYKSCFTKE